MLPESPNNNQPPAGPPQPPAGPDPSSIYPTPTVSPSEQPTPQFIPQPSSIYPQPVEHVQPPLPPTPQSVADPVSPEALMPQPVVRVLSPRGVEYVFMTIALLTGAVGLVSGLIAMVNGQFGFSALAFPVSLLVVALPIFTWLFMRLKDAEQRNPNLRLDASKRRSTQFIQIASFVVSFFTLIGGVATVFAKLSGDYNGSIVKVILDVLVVVLVAGGLLFYYWRDEHRSM